MVYLLHYYLFVSTLTVKKFLNCRFKEFTFEVVVDKKYCTEEVLEVYKKAPVVLPAWDPMGSLASS